MKACMKAASTVLALLAASPAAEAADRWVPLKAIRGEFLGGAICAPVDVTNITGLVLPPVVWAPLRPERHTTRAHCKNPSPDIASARPPIPPRVISTPGGIMKGTRI